MERKDPGMQHASPAVNMPPLQAPCLPGCQYTPPGMHDMNTVIAILGIQRPSFTNIVICKSLILACTFHEYMHLHIMSTYIVMS